MTRASRNLLAGALTLVAGLGLWLFGGGLDLRWVEPAKAGVVMMCAGGAEVGGGRCRARGGPAGGRRAGACPGPGAARRGCGRAQRSPPGTHRTSPVALLATRARMNRRSESRLR
ncbi:DUF5708 family protein [Streptomyces pilosus]